MNIRATVRGDLGKRRLRVKLGARTVLVLLSLVPAVLLAACASPATPSVGQTPIGGATAVGAALEPMDLRKAGELAGVTFLVGEGSEATFTVKEQLSRLPLPNDAVVRTSAISGEIHLDGRPSVIHIDLHRLSSDQSVRDRYIRQRMFPNDPIASFAVADLDQLPEGFTDGETVKGMVTGLLSLRGITVPFSFEVEARDDGDVLFVLGRTSFTWSDFGMQAPNIAGRIQVTDEVRVEILLEVRPFLNPGQ